MCRSPLLGWLDETELETIPQRHVISNDLDPLPSGEGDPPAEQHPTTDDITRLVETARAANVDLEAFGHDMRRLMELPESQKTTKKFLRETMTMAQYNTARAHYGEALRVIIEGDTRRQRIRGGSRDHHRRAPRGPFSGRIIICTRARHRRGRRG